MQEADVEHVFYNVYIGDIIVLTAQVFNDEMQPVYKFLLLIQFIYLSINLLIISQILYNYYK